MYSFLLEALTSVCLEPGVFPKYAKKKFHFKAEHAELMVNFTFLQIGDKIKTQNITPEQN